MFKILFLLVCVCSTDQISQYKNAQFVPNDIHFLFDMKNSVNSICDCVSYCSNNSMCLTAVYSDLSKQCTLLSAKLNQGQLQLRTTDLMMSVLSFTNKTLPGMLTDFISLIIFQFFFRSNSIDEDN